jgi:hypothetical protein
MTVKNVKAMVAKMLVGGFLAGALLMAAPHKAEAQQFAVGVHFGGPRYGYYHDDHIRREEFRRHDEFVRNEEWRRIHEHRGYRYDAPYRYR